jgi:MYXO-CTERM domain-containing protein
VTGGLTEVDLPLPDGATRLENVDILARNCIDTMACPVQVGTMFFRRCAIEPKALADGNFDFLYARPAVDTAPEDEFGEVQMFYHADRVLQKFRDLGFVDLRQKPMEVIVNYREPASNQQQCSGMTGTAPLLPYPNAFFTSGSVFHGWPTAPSIVFGQGPIIDYAYDGDVVYHEFTHGVQDVLYNIATVFPDQYGLDASGGAMNEATADYFSSSITGDPKVGEYAAQDTVGATFIRDISGDKKCPDGLTGEVHDDSEPFSSALWDVRIALPEQDRVKFDAAVYTAMDAFADFETFGSAREKIVADTRVRLGDAAATLAADKMAARGLDGCNRRIIDTTLGAKKPFIWIYGTEISGGSVAEIPAAYQFKVELTAPADKLFLTVDKRGNQAQSTGPLHVILKPGGEPIVWNPNTLTNDGVRSLPWSISGMKTITIPGPFPAGPLMIQLSNTASGTWILIDLIIFTDKEGVPATPLFDAGVDPMTGGGGGCCQVGGGPGAAGALLMVGMVLLALRRRRR